MTYDEVMALSGRELDAAVAEHVYRREVQWLTISGLRIPRFRTGDGWQVVAEFSCGNELAISIMAWVLSRGAWAQITLYETLWDQAGLPASSAWAPRCAEAALTKLILEDKLPEAICRAAVYVATLSWWTGSNDSNQCESSDDAEECDA